MYAVYSMYTNWSLSRQYERIKWSLVMLWYNLCRSSKNKVWVCFRRGFKIIFKILLFYEFLYTAVEVTRYILSHLEDTSHSAEISW